MSNKLLSVLVFGRNDDYKSDTIAYKKRLNYFINTLKKELSNISWELVFIEYNPPKNRPMLVELDCFVNVPLNHVIVSHDEWDEFITKHEQSGARLVYNRKIINFRKYPICVSHAYYRGLHESRGKYIFYTTTDNIFLGLSSVIKQIKGDNIIFRANKTWYKWINKKWKPSKKALDLWRGCGDFLIIPRRKCLEFGGFPLFPHPHPLGIDAIVMFFAMACGCKVKKINYRFMNMHVSSEVDSSTRLNYYVSGYNHHTWMRRNKEFQKFKKWAVSEKYSRISKRHIVRYNPRKIINIFKKIMEK